MAPGSQPGNCLSNSGSMASLTCLPPAASFNSARSSFSDAGTTAIASLSSILTITVLAKSFP